LLEVTHGITVAKVGTPPDPSQSEEERAALDEWSQGLSFPLLHRLWQLLLKGHEEVARAADPREAADMAILRLIHASQLPDPGDVIRKLEAGATFAAPAGTSAAPQAAPPATYAALIEFLAQNGRAHMAQQLHDYVGLVHYAPGNLVVRPSKPLPSDFIRDLATALKTLFVGIDWDVSTSDATAEPTLLDQERSRDNAARDAILGTPLVKAAFESFPEAELIDFDAGEQRSVH
jgi:DNA polymerase III subunit gamma/tau